MGIVTPTRAPAVEPPALEPDEDLSTVFVEEPQAARDAATATPAAAAASLVNFTSLLGDTDVRGAGRSGRSTRTGTAFLLRHRAGTRGIV